MLNAADTKKLIQYSHQFYEYCVRRNNLCILSLYIKPLLNIFKNITAKFRLISK